MNWPLFAAAAAALSLERVCYVLVWRYPHAFRAWCGRPPLGPVHVLATLFVVFKLLQLSTFLIWCYVHGDGTLAPQAFGVWTAAGALLVATGQVLNAGVFRQLGVVGVFYGNRLGHQVPWCSEFPFSCCRHPQYVGSVLSVWGFFLIMRFPHADWVVLPLLETAYYILGARLER